MTTVTDPGTPSNTTPAVEHVVSGGTIANPTPVAAPVPVAPVAAAPAASSTTPTWPDDWRAQMAGDDEKELKQIGRYATPAEVWRKNRELERKLSGGTLKPTLAADATDEDIAEFRKAHGIPDTAEKYDLADLKFGETLKPVVAEVLKAGHAAHLRSDQVRAVLAVLPGIQEAAMAGRQEMDQQIQTKAEDALRAEWGADFRRHNNLIMGLLDSTMTPKDKELFLGGRLADGTPIASHPETLKALLSVALIKNPTGVVVPSVSGDPQKGLDDAIKEIEDFMRTNRASYNRDEKKQARLRDLYNAREQLKARG